MTRELRIGIFVGMAFLILAVFTFIVGDLATLFHKAGYPVSAEFPSAAGLERRAPVKMAGVKIGLVKDIHLSGRQARVLMDIDAGVQIPKDSVVTFSMTGLLGEKAIEILPGLSSEVCRSGDVLTPKMTLGFDDLGPAIGSIGDKLKSAGDAVSETLNAETRANLNRTLESLTELTTEIRDLVRRNQGGIVNTVRDAGGAVENLDRAVGDVSAAARETIRLIRDIAAENRDSLKLSLERIKDLVDRIEGSLELVNSALQKINRGEGSLGKVIQDPELYEKAGGVIEDVRKTTSALSSVKSSLDIETGYYRDSALVRSAFTAGVRFGRGAWVGAGLVRDPWRKTFTLSLQGGYRWGDFSARAGFIESEFGLAMDYSALEDRWVTSLEAFDFNRATSPHLRLSTRFFPIRNVFLMIGADDFTLSGRRDVFFGLGLSWR